MTTALIYCSKCRTNYAERIARMKSDTTVMRHVVITGVNHSGAYLCKCEKCGHMWKSKSPEAAKLFKQIR